MPIPYPAIAVANELIVLSRPDKLVTPLKLHKLIYFAHGWHLGFFGSPLVGEPFQAWRYGPVVPSLYRELRDYGDGSVRELIRDPFFGFENVQEYPRCDDGDSSAKEVIKTVWDAYGGLPALKLSEMTHAPGTPWRKIYDRYGSAIPWNMIVATEDIKSHFAEVGSRCSREKVGDAERR
jgi:uncharacterized phage-associated protein